MSGIPLISIVGTTASGKTSLAVDTAIKYNGEVISADSMQIYKGFDVGTAKVTEAETCGVPHYMIDIIDGDASYSVAQFCKDANNAADEIVSHGFIPILAGGTGLYVDSFINNIRFFDFKRDEAYAFELDEIVKTKGGDELWKMLNEADPALSKTIPANNVKRLKHALEVYNATGKTYSQISEESRQPSRFDACKIGLRYNDRELLYRRINERVDKMVGNGLVDEVEGLLKVYSPECQAMNAIGYKEIAEHLCGKISLDEAIEKVKLNSRRYAKRQLTWFNRDKEIHWIAVDGPDDVKSSAYKVIDEWLGGK